MALQFQYHMSVSVSLIFRLLKHHKSIPYTGIDENMCYCAFRIANMEIDLGEHSITFQAILNGEVRGSTTSQFFVTDSKFICII